MSDKYKELLDAVHALNPFDDQFSIVESRSTVWGSCQHCEEDSTMSASPHTPECPVTHLRNVLNEVEEKKCSEDQGYKLVYAPHRDELDKAIQIIERHRLSKLNAKAVIDYSGALESAIVDEVLYIKNASDKDVVIPLDKPFIKSPTDNGV